VDVCTDEYHWKNSDATSREAESEHKSDIWWTVSNEAAHRSYYNTIWPPSGGQRALRWGWEEPTQLSFSNPEMGSDR